MGCLLCDDEDCNTLVHKNEGNAPLLYFICNVLFLKFGCTVGGNVAHGLNAVLTQGTNILQEKVETDMEQTYLDSFMTLSLDIASLDPGSHIVHDDGARATIHKDTALR